MESDPRIQVSWGELFDKLSILEIKSQRITESGALAHVRHELEALRAAAGAVSAGPELAGALARLKRVNEALWDCEAQIRRKDTAEEFDAGFTALARSIYRLNDERAAVKRLIGQLLGSQIVEIKSY